MQDFLHTLLHEWKVEPASDPNFRGKVWGRIAERKRRLSFRVWCKIEKIVAQPVWAAAAVAAMMFIGTAAGNAWREREVRHERTAGLTAYVLAVNPVAHVASLPR